LAIATDSSPEAALRDTVSVLLWSAQHRSALCLPRRAHRGSEKFRWL